MMRIATWALAATMMVLSGGAAFAACEDYKALGADELKDYRSKLQQADADPLDQLFAFQEMICSDSPTVRAYAVRAGLSASTDPTLRQEVMLDALLDKARIDIQLAGGSDATKNDKEFIKRFSGTLTYTVRYRSPTDGCIDFNYDDNCSGYSTFFIKGDKVQLTDNDLVGQFELSDSNELVGFIRARSTDDYSRIPAVIALF